MRHQAFSFFSLSTKEHQPALHYHHNDKNMTIIKTEWVTLIHQSITYCICYIHVGGTLTWHRLSDDRSHTYCQDSVLFTTRLSAALCINHCVTWLKYTSTQDSGDKLDSISVNQTGMTQPVLRLLSTWGQVGLNIYIYMFVCFPWINEIIVLYLLYFCQRLKFAWQSETFQWSQVGDSFSLHCRNMHCSEIKEFTVLCDLSDH